MCKNTPYVWREIQLSCLDPDVEVNAFETDIGVWVTRVVCGMDKGTVNSETQVLTKW